MADVFGNDPVTSLSGDDKLTALVRLVPGYRRFRTWRVRSTALFITAAIVGALTHGLDTYFDWREARYASERTITMATVVSSWFLLPRARRYERPPEFCLLRYRFTPTPQSRSYSGWRVGSNACWLKTGAPVLIEYVATRPEMNRLVNSGGTGAVIVRPLWVLTILLVIWGVLQRRAEGPMVGRDGHVVPAVVESISEQRPGSFVLTYSYEAGVKGRKYGQCEVDENTARQLAPGTAGRAMVDPMHPSRSDWVGPQTETTHAAIAKQFPDRFGS